MHELDSIDLDRGVSPNAPDQRHNGSVDREIILVSGSPGSGKSTLARQLSAVTGLSLISKDVIKESLWDALQPPPGDLSWSRQLGGAAMECFGRSLL